MTRSRTWTIASAAALVAAIIAGWTGRGWLAHSPVRSVLAGSDACRTCHATQFALWQGSHHAHALHPAQSLCVRSEFTGKAPDAQGESWEPVRNEGFGFRHTRAGENPESLRVAFTIGWEPLQQYLVTLPNGRLQPAPLAFDPARREWFDVFRDDPRQPSDPGYWRNRGMNANTMCIECHVTGYDKGYDPLTDVYHSTWNEPGVGCEACHGPGAEHVAWASSGKAAGATHLVRLKDLSPDRFLAVCAACHARRLEIAANFRPGAEFADHFLPELMEGPEAYYPDGQIHGESFEYGSFVQSVMYRKGVRCSDCHEPHSGALRAEGNALCVKCHDPSFDATAHTNHAAGSAGARCVSCHMPVTTYMMRHPRRDHSFSVPVPENTVAAGIPNACNRCHSERTSEWTIAQIRRRSDERKDRLLRRARAFEKGRQGDPAGVADLLAVVEDPAEPASVRASAAQILGPHESAAGVANALVRALEDESPLVRAAAAAGLPDSQVPQLVKALGARLDDPVRLVRVRAAWALRRPERKAETLPGGTRAFAEFEAWNAGLADRPESHLSLGILWTDRGRPDRAVDAYTQALRLDPRCVPALFNRALVLHGLGRRVEAEADLEAARRIDPEWIRRLEEPGK